jgi:hypothetical protein
MLGKLSEKMAGVNRKRVYTAVAALLIAGAAGQFMQRGNTPKLETAMAPPAAQPDVAPASMPDDIAAVMMPEASNPGAIGPDATAPAIDTAMLAEPAATDAMLDDMSAVIEPLAVVAANVIDTLPDAAFTEVTRAATEPLRTLAMPEPIPLPTPEAVVSAPLTLAAVDSPEELAPPPMPAMPETLATACDIQLSAELRPGALVFLSLEAPCNSGETVQFDHAGLKFSEQLDTQGGLVVLVPAMTESAIFSVAFEDGQHKSISTTVPDLADFERLALVWQGGTGLQLHALENGAFYGDAGHVWAESPSLPANAVSGQGGFVSVLGGSASGYAADVYTFPLSLMREGASPEVSIEAQVAETTCGTEIEGTILHANPGSAPDVSDLAMSVPGCDAVGEYLVLKNLPQHLRIAAN